MTAFTATTEPSSIIAGDTAKWLKTLTDYPASTGWSLAYMLVNAGSRYNFSGAMQSDSYLVTVAATVTATWAAGTYAWRAQVSKSGEVYTVGSGNIEIKASFASAIDTRSTAKIMLDNVNAALTKTASENVMRYMIAGRELFHYGIPELLQLRDRLTAEVARENIATSIANGQGNPGRIQVRQ